MEERLDLAVIESRWWDRSNDSVRGIFDMLAGIHHDNPFAYHYEMFSSGDSLREIIKRIAASKDLFNIYIGAHGSETEIHGPGDIRISRTVLRNTLKEIGASKLHGLFFGCCGFGNQIESLASKTNLTWIAGYTEDVDWLHSCAMDLYFWNAYYQCGFDKQRTRTNRAELMEILLGVLMSRVPYLFTELGFQVAIWKRRGRFRIFPNDWDKDELGHWKIETDKFVANYPGQWPDGR